MPRPQRAILFGIVAALIVVAGIAAGVRWRRSAREPGDWRSYGRDPGGARFSPLVAIDRQNVGKLRRAWTFHTGDLAEGQLEPLETTPLAIDGTLYLTTSLRRARRASAASSPRRAASSSSRARTIAASARSTPTTDASSGRTSSKPAGMRRR